MEYLDSALQNEGVVDLITSSVATITAMTFGQYMSFLTPVAAALVRYGIAFRKKESNPGMKAIKVGAEIGAHQLVDKTIYSLEPYTDFSRKSETRFVRAIGHGLVSGFFSNSKQEFFKVFCSDTLLSFLNIIVYDKSHMCPCTCCTFFEPKKNIQAFLPVIGFYTIGNSLINFMNNSFSIGDTFVKTLFFGAGTVLQNIVMQDHYITWTAKTRNTKENFYNTFYRCNCINFIPKNMFINYFSFPKLSINLGISDWISDQITYLEEQINDIFAAIKMAKELKKKVTIESNEQTVE